MDRYRQNAKWLTYFSPFRELSVSAAYLTPFFFQHGLNLYQIFILQSIFSVAVLLWEIPSGFLADKFGRALSIKLSAPIAASAMIAYGLSSHFWQFVICELILAIGNGMISGIDTALLLDSLKADGRENQFVKISRKIAAYGFAASGISVPLAMLLVHYVSIGSTLVMDGLFTGVGAVFALRLVEAPRFKVKQEAVRLSAWHSMKELRHNKEAIWLVVLGATLSSTTLIGFWMSAPYYTSIGISVVYFSAILAARNLWKAWLSHNFSQDRHLERSMVSYAFMAGLVSLAMATQQIWLVWTVLGHDIIQALSGQPITSLLNNHFEHEFRATMNSVVNLVRRFIFTFSGPLIGFAADKFGLSTGFVILGIVSTSVTLIAIFNLHKLKTFTN